MIHVALVATSDKTKSYGTLPGRPVQTVELDHDAAQEQVSFHETVISSYPPQADPQPAALMFSRLRIHNLPYS